MATISQLKKAFYFIDSHYFSHGLENSTMTFDVVVVRTGSQHIITSAYYNTGTLTVYGTSSVDVTIYVLY